MPATRPLAERFWEKVDKRGPVGPYADTPCWQWTASKDRKGYGCIGIRGSRSCRAHRVSWILHHGSIPDRMYVLHRCHNTSCVNPAHLYLGTHLDNMRDKTQAGRENCVRGVNHPNTSLSDDQVHAILTARSSGASAAELGRRYGITTSAVCDICSGRSWKYIDRSAYDPGALNPGPRKGAGHPRYKITSEMRAAIAQMRSTGATWTSIARHFGISAAGAYKACKAMTL